MYGEAHHGDGGTKARLENLPSGWTPWLMNQAPAPSVAAAPITRSTVVEPRLPTVGWSFPASHIVPIACAVVWAPAMPQRHPGPSSVAPATSIPIVPSTALPSAATAGVRLSPSA